MTIRFNKLDWRQIVSLIAFDGDVIYTVANFELEDGYAPISEVEQKIYSNWHFDKVKKFKMTMFAHNDGETYYVMRADRPLELDILKEAHERFLADN